MAADLILNGQLYHGFNGHAGEIGHIIIGWKNGIELEAIAGRRNLMNRATRRHRGFAQRPFEKTWKGLDPTTFKSSQIAEVRRERRSGHCRTWSTKPLGPSPPASGRWSIC